MQISIQRDELLKPLTYAAGVVERRQTLPVLSNVLLQVKDGSLVITATDLEIEVVATTSVKSATDGEITVPARKLLDICKSLPDDSIIEIKSEAEKISVKSGKSRFSLVTLPATEFPNIETTNWDKEISLAQGAIRRILEKTQFCMAQQDVRYYMNGLLIEMQNKLLKAVGTDGHRMGVCDLVVDALTVDENSQIIVPRKGVLELIRFLEPSDASAVLRIGKNHIQVEFGDIKFTSKLIDGRFPDYTRVIPGKQTKSVSVDKEQFKKAIQRVSILSNEKFKGIVLGVGNKAMNISTHNPEQEEAQEEIVIDYDQENTEIGFNSNFIVDAVSGLTGASIDIGLTDGNSIGSFTCKEDSDTLYLIMPMRL
ncbi:MAG: DNA polymerase III subunit beta [Gammaproteobacteria bacterium]|nr:DNA polymerase III subunit beta [Gammaproteobacteria bacterium]